MQAREVCPIPYCCTGSAGFICSSGSPACGANGEWACPLNSTQCTPPPPPYDTCPGGSYKCMSSGWTCTYPLGGTPIIIDVKGEGFHLTSVDNGVNFTFFPNQPAVRISWTDSAFSNGFLALDRNGNGIIDDGTELFGNLTPQPPSSTPNGYAALAVFDEPANGGNGNGVIDPGDSVYGRLRVWIDANHNGFSEPSELHTLHELGISRIGLKYRLSSYVDQYGNRFRYLAQIWDEAGKAHDLCYDVSLVIRPN